MIPQKVEIRPWACLYSEVFSCRLMLVLNSVSLLKYPSWKGKGEGLCSYACELSFIQGEGVYHGDRGSWWVSLVAHSKPFLWGACSTIRACGICEGHEDSISPGYGWGTYLVRVRLCPPSLPPLSPQDMGGAPTLCG